MNDTKTAALVAEVERLTKELADLNRDAERYRWLRDHCTLKENPSDTWILESEGESWDDATDEAMQRTGAVSTIR